MGKFNKKPKPDQQRAETTQDKLRKLSAQINHAAASVGIGSTKAQKFVHGDEKLLAPSEQHELISALGGGKAYEELRDSYRSLHL
jgi:hypothetical protein